LHADDEIGGLPRQQVDQAENPLFRLVDAAPVGRQDSDQAAGPAQQRRAGEGLGRRPR